MKRNFPFMQITLTYLMIFAAILSSCSKSPEELARLKDLATTKKIAIVGFVGKSVAGRQSSAHEPLLKAMYEAFQKKASGNRDVVEIIPIEEVVRNDVYHSMAADTLPPGLISPMPGLTYLKQIGPQSIGSLNSALKADALLTVIANFGVDQRNNGSTYFLTAKPICTLLIPPERLVWGSLKEPVVTQETMLPISLFSNSKLALSLGAKWVAMSGPGESDYAELMKIASESGANMATKTGEELFDRLTKDIKEARTVKIN